MLSVLGFGGEDAIAGREADRIERHVPGHGGVLDERDLRRSAFNKSRDRIVDRFAPIVGCSGGLVAAGLGLEPQVAQLRLKHRRRHQRRARIVEVQDLAPRPACPARARSMSMGMEVFAARLQEIDRLPRCGARGAGVKHAAVAANHSGGPIAFDG